jgi:hypothetical protein
MHGTICHGAMLPYQTARCVPYPRWETTAPL